MKMIIAQRPPRVDTGKCDYDRFGEEMPDGRLVEPGGKMYRLREAIREVERLGRPLTEEEMRQFEIEM